MRDSNNPIGGQVIEGLKGAAAWEPTIRSWEQ